MLEKMDRLLLTLGLFPRLLFVIHLTLGVQESTLEVCDVEDFIARCPFSQQIIITKALFGHMKQGRCIGLDLGHFGCFANVENIVEKRCSGKQRCEISMPDEEMEATNPCVKGLETYLEASYACIPETLPQTGCNGVSVNRKQQYITSKQIRRLACNHDQERNGNSQLFLGEESLNIQFTFEIIHVDKSHNGSVPATVGFILDGKGGNTTVSFSKEEAISEVKIHSDTARLDLTAPGNIVLIGFEATGCKDYEAPAYTWIERQGDVTTLGCHNNKHTWQVRCIGSRWIGTAGNCTEPTVVLTQPPRQKAEISPKEVQDEQTLSREILYALIIGITLFLCTVTITTGYVCLKRTKYKTQGKGNIEMQAMVYDGTDTNSWTRQTNTKSGGILSQNNLPNTWQATLVKPANDTNGTISGATKKYYILDQDYVNANDT